MYKKYVIGYKLKYEFWLKWEFSVYMFYVNEFQVFSNFIQFGEYNDVYIKDIIYVNEYLEFQIELQCGYNIGSVFFQGILVIIVISIEYNVVYIIGG